MFVEYNTKSSNEIRLFFLSASSLQLLDDQENFSFIFTNNLLKIALSVFRFSIAPGTSLRCGSLIPINEKHFISISINVHSLCIHTNTKTRNDSIYRIDNLCRYVWTMMKFYEVNLKMFHN
jgi:hypothetical protein